MCADINGIALLKITLTGSTSVTLPDESTVTPSGAFIQALAATTDTLPRMPARTMGTPVQKGTQGLSLCQPKMYIEMKMASVKKKIPSKAKSMTKAARDQPMKRGPTSPNSKLSTVPVTSPTANVTSMYFDQLGARSIASLSSCLIPR